MSKNPLRLEAGEWERLTADTRDPERIRRRLEGDHEPWISEPEGAVPPDDAGSKRAQVDLGVLTTSDYTMMQCYDPAGGFARAWLSCRAPSRWTTFLAPGSSGLPDETVGELFSWRVVQWPRAEGPRPPGHWPDAVYALVTAPESAAGSRARCGNGSSMRRARVWFSSMIASGCRSAGTRRSCSPRAAWSLTPNWRRWRQAPTESGEVESTCVD